MSEPNKITTSIEDTSLFNEVNDVTNRAAQKELLDLFKIDAFVRVDSFFISPFSLVSIKRGLSKKILRWEFSVQGWRFLFKDGVEIFFRGRLSSLIKDGKILFIKIDSTKVEYTSRSHYAVLVRYLKCLDTFYFMVTEIDTSFTLLSNPLSINYR